MAAKELALPFSAAALAGGALLIFLFVAEPPRFAYALPGLAFLGALLWGWISTYRRLQALEDIPLARIGTAAQGYTRLQGRAALFPGSSLRSPVTSQPCCWYSYSVTTYDEQGEVQSSESDTTQWSFMMTDGSGECVIDPVGARVIAARVNSYRDKQQAWTEEIIVAREPLAVVGEFTTSGASVSEAEIEARTGALLAQWKKERRYGAEGWDRVRAQARREVEADIARHPPQPQHRMAAPGDGRPYLISTQGDGQLARDLRIWAWIYVVGFVAGAAALGWLLLRW